MNTTGYQAHVSCPNHMLKYCLGQYQEWLPCVIFSRIFSFLSSGGRVHDQYDLLPLLHSESHKCFTAQGGTEGSFTFLIAAPKLLGSSLQVRILAS